MQTFMTSMSSAEFWSALVALSAVGVAYFGQDAIRDELVDGASPWRWGQKYRRPKEGASWGSHWNCAFGALICSCISISILL